MHPRTAAALAAVFVLTMTLLTVPSADASIEEGNLRFDPSTGQVTGYIEEPVGILEIPRYINGTSVVGIGDGAFEGCERITGLSLPDSIRTIGDIAFKDCTGLSGTLQLPRSVQTLGDSAFMNCGGITGTLSVPNSLQSIGAHAFEGCSGIKTITYGISPSLTFFGDSSFKDCTGLSGTLNLPSKLRSIGENAFENCMSLKGTLYLPNSLRSVGDGAFNGCAGLSGTVSIPQSLESFGTLVFAGCPQVDGFSVHRDNRWFSSSDGVLCSRDMKEIVSGAEGMEGTLGISGSIVEIHDYAFAGSGIDSVIFAEDGRLSEISENAFAGCKIGSLELPESLKTIGKEAFLGCPLSLLVLNQGLESIGRSAFADTEQSGILEIPESVREIQPGAFMRSGLSGFSADGNPYFAADGQGILYTQNGKGIVMAGDLTELKIPGSVTEIGELAFAHTSLKDVKIPGGVRTIGKDAFLGCLDAAVLSLPSGITLGNGAFSGCTGLENVEFRGNPDRVAEDAFSVEFYDGTTFDSDEDRMDGSFHRDYANGSPLVKMMTVVFDTGSRTYAVDVMYGDTVDRPENPERNGYSFDGWLRNGERYDFGSPVTSDMVLTAAWVLTPVPEDEDRDVEYLPVLALSIIMFGSVLGMFYLTAREK